MIPFYIVGRILLAATASGRLDVPASLVGILLGALIPINSQVHVRYHLFDLPGRERIAGLEHCAIFYHATVSMSETFWAYVLKLI